MSIDTKPKPLSIAVLAAALVLLAGPAGAAIGDHIWSTDFPAEAVLASDASDNIVVHGAFFGTIDLGGGPMTAINFLDGDQFLAKFDANGNHIWSLQFTPVGNGASDEVVAVDPAGNIYIAGRVFGTTDIDYGGGAISGQQIYVAKFDSNGNHLWSAGYGDGVVKAIAADNSSVVVTGYTSAGVDFGGGTVGNSGLNDAFVARLTAAGAHSWSAGFGDASDQGGMAVTLDGSGNVLLVGSMMGTVDFGGGPLVANGLDLFLASFTPAGAHQWSQVYDGVFTAGGGILVTTDVAAGPSGEVVIAGEMRGSVDFGGGPVTSTGFSDLYVVSFDAAGNHQWSDVYGSTTSSDYAQAVSVDGSGNVLVTGTFGGDADFGGGTIVLNGSRDAVAAVYDGAGVHLFSAGYGTAAYTCRSGFDASGRMLLTGYGSGVDMGGGALAGGPFVGKLEGTGGTASGIGEVPGMGVSGLRAFPNPFNPTTTIEYTLAAPAQASLSVYDVRGRLIQELVPARWHAAGRHEARFVAGASGVYFVRLRAGGTTRTIKTVAIK